MFKSREEFSKAKLMCSCCNINGGLVVLSVTKMLVVGTRQFSYMDKWDRGPCKRDGWSCMIYFEKILMQVEGR